MIRSPGEENAWRIFSPAVAFAARYATASPRRPSKRFIAIAGCVSAHGAPVIAWLTAPLTGFAVTSGDPIAYRSSAKALRHFCGSCGTPLTWRATDNPRLVDVSIATLDNPEAVEPALHLWTDSQIAWFEIADHLPRHPTNERPKPAL